MSKIHPVETFGTHGGKIVVTELMTILSTTGAINKDPVIGKPANSQIHSLIESNQALIEKAKNIHRIDPTGRRQFISSLQNEQRLFKTAQVFISNLNWTWLKNEKTEKLDPAALREFLRDVKLPFDDVIFEMTIDGFHTILYFATDPITFGAPETDVPFGGAVHIRVGNVWIDCPWDHDLLSRFWQTAFDQAIGTIFAMEMSEITSRTLNAAPTKLNKKREKSGGQALRDFYVLDIISKYKKQSETAVVIDDEEARRRMRQHFRRGHWRRPDDAPQIWIRWMLVGDPDLGFINKTYRL